MVFCHSCCQKINQHNGCKRLQRLNYILNNKLRLRDFWLVTIVIFVRVLILTLTLNIELCVYKLFSETFNLHVKVSAVQMTNLSNVTD